MNYFCQLFVIYYNNLLLQVIRNSKLFIATKYIYIYIYIIASRLLKYLKFIAFIFLHKTISSDFIAKPHINYYNDYYIITMISSIIINIFSSRMCYLYFLQNINLLGGNNVIFFFFL